MNRRDFLCAVPAVVAVGRISHAQEKPVAAPKAKTDLGELLEAIRKEHGLPGLAAAASRGDRLIAEGVAGVRRVGKDDRITIDDRFAIGSVTKLLTGLLIARLIDAGKLSFETRLADALPQVTMADAYREVTVAQLLNFTGGIQPYTRISPMTTPVLFETAGTPAERRTRFVEQVLNEEPVAKPGTQSHYSNAGYVVLGQVAAARHGGEFEGAMKQHVFGPLGLSRAGFGHPCTKDRPNEPWLHVKRGEAFEPVPDRDWPVEVVMAAAGDVHCSIRDLAKLASYELLASQGNDPQLKPATAKRMQELTNPTGKDDFAAFGGTPWLSAGVQYVASKNLAVAFAINAGSRDNPGKAVLKAIGERLSEN